MLSPDEAARLWARRDAGDADARARLIESHLWLVYATRARLVPIPPRAIEEEDLHSVGMIALVRAVDRYDTARQVKFTSYAISMVRGAMLEWLRREEPLTRDLRAKKNRMDAAEESLLTEQVAPTAERIADRLGVDEERVVRWRIEIDRRDLDWLDRPLPGRPGWRELTIADQVSDPSPSPEEQVVARLEFARLLRQAEEVMRLLRDRERIAITETELNLKTEREVAPLLGVSHWRVRQIKAAALVKAQALAAEMEEES